MTEKPEASPEQEGEEIDLSPELENISTTEEEVFDLTPESEILTKLDKEKKDKKTP